MPFLLTVIRANSPIYLFLKLIKMLHETLDARFIDMVGNLKRENFYRRNQSSNFLRSSFGTRDNARALNLFPRERTVLASQKMIFDQGRTYPC